MFSSECGLLIVNRGKVKSTREISLPEGRIDNIEESYKYKEVRFKAIWGSEEQAF